MNYVDKLLEVHNLYSLAIERVGIEAVAEKSGLTKRIVKQYCVDPMKSKNSDVNKIRTALVELAPEEVDKIKENTK